MIKQVVFGATFAIITALLVLVILNMVAVPVLLQALLIAVIAFTGLIVMKTGLNMSVERIGVKNA